MSTLPEPKNRKEKIILFFITCIILYYVMIEVALK